MHSIFRLFYAFLALVLLVGCAGPGAMFPSAPKVAQSQKPRVANVNVSDSDQATLSEGNLTFAADLYHKVVTGSDNLFFSPYSISLALAMTYAGAEGQTEAQMAQTLHFSLPQDRLHPAFNTLDQQLASRKNGSGQGADGKGFRFNVVNDLWGQQDYKFQPAFLDLLSANYGAGLRLVDFKTNAEAARQAINNDIAKKTEQRIKDLLAPGTLDAQTRLVLTNAIYFNAAWQFQFEKDDTTDAPFTHLEGSSVTVPMMRSGESHYFNYLAGQGYQAVALPYEGQQISMVILLPDAGNFARFEQSIDGAQLQKILADLQQNRTNIVVSLPRFQLEEGFSLGQTLASMGMKDALTFGLADFSGMDGTNDLFISDVIHKTFVKVDEAGTEAAAATAVIMPTGAMPGEPVKFTADRPFLFLIVDQPTNTILFFGRVTDPK